MYLNGKYSYKGNNQFDDGISTTIIKRGVVIDIADPTDMGRIKVYINGIDDPKAGVTDLPWSFPLLPKFTNTQPKIGEAVLIFLFDTDKPRLDRMYLGPVISQPQMLKFDRESTTAWSGFSFRKIEPQPAPSTYKELRGIFPNNQDVYLQGRDNTDIIFKNNEVLIRAGKYVKTGDDPNDVSDFPKGFNIKFNRKTQGFIQMRYNVPISKKDSNNKEIGTVTNIVANKINLLTHKDGNPRFNLTNQDDLISNDEILKILDEAHPLMFGDKVLEFLKLIKDALNNHVHPYHGKKWEDLGSNTTIKDMNQFNLDELLSKNIRIN